MADGDPPRGPDPALEAERQALLRQLEELRGVLDAATQATGQLGAASRPPSAARELGAFFGAALLGGAFLLANQLALATLDAGEVAAWRGGPGASLEVGGGLCLVAGLGPLWLHATGLAYVAPRGPAWREPLLAAVTASVPTAAFAVALHVSKTVGGSVDDLAPAAVLLSPRAAAALSLGSVVWLLVLGLRLRRPVSDPPAAPTGSP